MNKMGCHSHTWVARYPSDQTSEVKDTIAKSCNFLCFKSFWITVQANKSAAKLKSISNSLKVLEYNNLNQNCIRKNTEFLIIKNGKLFLKDSKKIKDRIQNDRESNNHGWTYESMRYNQCQIKVAYNEVNKSLFTEIIVQLLFEFLSTSDILTLSCTTKQLHILSHMLIEVNKMFTSGRFVYIQDIETLSFMVQNFSETLVQQNETLVQQNEKLNTLENLPYEVREIKNLLTNRNINHDTSTIKVIKFSRSSIILSGQAFSVELKRDKTLYENFEQLKDLEPDLFRDILMKPPLSNNIILGFKVTTGVNDTHTFSFTRYNSCYYNYYHHIYKLLFIMFKFYSLLYLN
jgi:hypothetical protein